MASTVLEVWCWSGIGESAAPRSGRGVLSDEWHEDSMANTFRVIDSNRSERLQMLAGFSLHFME
jgi:hypothetical protein